MAARKGQGGKRPAPGAAAAPSSPPPVAADQHAAVIPEAVIAEGFGRYPVLSPLRFDGGLYGPDDPDANEVTMPREQAAALQPLGVLGEELA